MEKLTRETFDRLMRVENGLCVTLLMPTHRTGRENSQDPIRFKNLLQRAEAELTAQGMRSADARKRLHSFRELLDDSLFWSHQSSALAAFCSPEETLLYALPEELKELMVVDRRFHLTPVLPMLEAAGNLFLLAISPKSVRLWECARDTRQEVSLPDGPKKMEDIARYIESDRQLQFHTRAEPAGGRDRAAVFHGHAGGNSDSERKLRLLEYCRLIDARLHPVLNGRKEPLVLACDRRLAPIFREANSYAHLWDEPLEGNPDLRPPAELCSRAREAIRPLAFRGREETKTRVEAALARGRASQDLSTVLAAGVEGRVDSLLVAADARRWGRIDPDSKTAVVHENREPGDEELLNLAALAALRRGAAVHALGTEEMPGRKPLAAVMRY